MGGIRCLVAATHSRLLLLPLSFQIVGFLLSLFFLLLAGLEFWMADVVESQADEEDQSEDFGEESEADEILCVGRLEVESRMGAVEGWVDTPDHTPEEDENGDAEDDQCLRESPVSGPSKEDEGSLEDGQNKE